MLKSSFLSVLFAGTALLPFCDAEAVTITYFDRDAFLSATGSTPADPLPNLGLIPGGAGASQTIGDLTFSLLGSAYELYLGTGSGADWTDLVAGHQIAISGPEHLAISLANHTTDFGFDFVEPHQNTAHTNSSIIQDSTFTVSLFDGIALLDTFEFNAPGDMAYFVGFSSSLAFNRVHIMEHTETIDNEFYGGFYRKTAVPEPTTLALLGSALGLGYFRRNRRSAS